MLTQQLVLLGHSELQLVACSVIGNQLAFLLRFDHGLLDRQHVVQVVLGCQVLNRQDHGQVVAGNCRISLHSFNVCYQFLQLSRHQVLQGIAALVILHHLTVTLGIQHLRLLGQDRSQVVGRSVVLDGLTIVGQAQTFSLLGQHVDQLETRLVVGRCLTNNLGFQQCLLVRQDVLQVELSSAILGIFIGQSNLGQRIVGFRGQCFKLQCSQTHTLRLHLDHRRDRLDLGLLCCPIHLVFAQQELGALSHGSSHQLGICLGVLRSSNTALFILGLQVHTDTTHQGIKCTIAVHLAFCQIRDLQAQDRRIHLAVGACGHLQVVRIQLHVRHSEVFAGQQRLHQLVGCNVCSATHSHAPKRIAH